jgi:ferritin-like metal-binding protein YciE
MAETTKDQKLVQYLGEAYGKEKELEAALHSHIEMTDRTAYRKRLKQHLHETKNHARLVERRISKLGGGGHLLHNLAARGSAFAKAPMHARRGKSAEERMLKNAKTEYSEEAEEIATYTAIETLADTVGDSETAKMARQIRREEERMATFLARQIPILTKAVARAEIPASERNGTGSGRSRSAGTSRRRRGSGTRSSGARTRSRS